MRHCTVANPGISQPLSEEDIGQIGVEVQADTDQGGLQSVLIAELDLGRALGCASDLEALLSLRVIGLDLTTVIATRGADDAIDGMPSRTRSIRLGFAHRADSRQFAQPKDDLLTNVTHLLQCQARACLSTGVELIASAFVRSSIDSGVLVSVLAHGVLMTTLGTGCPATLIPGILDLLIREIVRALRILALDGMLLRLYRRDGMLLARSDLLQIVVHVRRSDDRHSYMMPYRTGFRASDARAVDELLESSPVEDAHYRTV